MNICPSRKHPGRFVDRQRGVVLLFALIALLIMMIGAVALVKSFNTSLLNTGSLAFKKDLVHRNEAAIARVLTRARQPGSLMNPAIAAATFPDMNYSPRILAYNEQGIPNLLLVDDYTFNSTGFTHMNNDIDLGVDQIKLRFVIDRQCSAAGLASVLGATQCIPAGEGGQDGGSSDTPIRAENESSGGAGGVTIVPIYRLTIRAIGPKGTLAFYQTTFTLR